MGASLFRGASGVASVVQQQADYTNTAISYFTSIRIPAALIAGSSLAALFTLTDRISDDKMQERSRIETIVLIAYHILALASLLLSLNVVVTSTASANSILLAPQNPLAANAYEFLMRDFEFEFLVTRWSFFSSLFSFLGSLGGRCLVEFDLLCKRRVRSALLILFSVSALFFHLLSFVNSRLFTYPDMGAMTWAVFRMWWKRSIEGYTSPAELASLVSFFGAICMTVLVFKRSALFSRDENIPPVSEHVDDVKGGSAEQETMQDAPVRQVIDEACDGDDFS